MIILGEKATLSVLIEALILELILEVVLFLEGVENIVYELVQIGMFDTSWCNFSLSSSSDD